MFFCDQYCKEQGQGHIHLFESSEKIQHDDVKCINKWSLNFFSNYKYECKCSFYWENILKFKSLYFTNDEKYKFSLCNWKCKYLAHPSEAPEYCQLPLWHKPENSIPKGIYGKWIYEGHIFKCNHPNGIYTIFLLDTSGSMSFDYAEPVNRRIRNRMDNMLGASVEAIENYCKLRNNPKDKYALISFSDKAEIVFEDFTNDEKDSIVEICLKKLKPNGNTYFFNAFGKANEIIQKIDRAEINPIIILLTDGLDLKPSETLKFLEKVS